jgi:hypothetical protein
MVDQSDSVCGEFKVKMAEKVSAMILKSMQTTALLNVGLLASIYFVTPLFRKAPLVSGAFFAVGVAQMVMTYLLNSRFRKVFAERLNSPTTFLEQRSVASTCLGCVFILGDL